MTTTWVRRTTIRCLIALECGFAFLGAANAQDAATLRAKQASLAAKLANNQFQRPLVLESTQSAGDLKGEVYAIVDQPFVVVGPALASIDHWCDLLMLHLNVKTCTFAGKPPSEVLGLVVGRKFDQPIDDGYKIEFAYGVPASAPDYLRVQMSSENGPMGTSNYRLALEAVPLDDRHSFIHMSYSYEYGMTARLAMSAYLATAGRDKVGFSITGKNSDGTPVYLGGVRGVIERNTMRYYLAIEAYLGSLSAPPADQVDKRLRDWYAATERFAPQLHEMDREEYMAMKRHEMQMQRSAAGRS